MIIHSMIITTIYFVLGWGAVKYQMVYTLWGTVYLEAINYLEHYGLRRNKDDQGIYESINNMHSWNSDASPALFRL